MVGVSSVPKRSQEPATPGATDQGQIDLLMRRFFEQNQNGPADIEGTAPPEPLAPTVRPARDFDMSTELLDRAAKAFDLLINRCTALEEDLNRETDRAKTQAAAQNDTIEQWKRLASGLQAQLETSEQAGAVLKQRCEMTEARADTAERKVTALERATADAASHAAIAEQMSTRLRDKVIVAFGIGSRAHPVLEAIATQVDAK